MALIKNKVLSSGVTVSFWIVTKMDIDWNRSNLKLIVMGYVSREAFENGATPLDVEKRNWSGNDFPLDKNQPNTVEQVYIKLKESKMGPVDDMSEELEEKEFFVDAVDDILNG